MRTVPVDATSGQGHFSSRTRDGIHGGTPLGWAVYGLANPAPEFRNARHHEVVELLVRAGAHVERDWLESSGRGASLAAKVQTDPRLRAALGLGK